jgi:hypothetical protein
LQTWRWFTRLFSRLLQKAAILVQESILRHCVIEPYFLERIRRGFARLADPVMPSRSQTVVIRQK